MTKKYLELFAALIRHSDNDAQCKTFAALVVARVASEFNPHFDRERFMRACGLEV